MWAQPIEMKFNEMLEGIRSDIAVKIFGQDYDTLEAKAEEIIAVLETIQGAGVEEKDLETMFERFSKVGGGEGKQPGTGLGLAVCKGIVELHGGGIRAFAKTVEQGFRVVWSLPLEV